jgi:nucleoside-diphosphate-sugar epimerase
MKVFVAGATGVLGRALVPQLVARGHEVVGMTRSPSKQDLVCSLGGRPVVADALDPAAVAQALACAEPEVIVQGRGRATGRRARRGCPASTSSRRRSAGGAPGGSAQAQRERAGNAPHQGQITPG